MKQQFALLHITLKAEHVWVGEEVKNNWREVPQCIKKVMILLSIPFCLDIFSLQRTEDLYKLLYMSIWKQCLANYADVEACLLH